MTKTILSVSKALFLVVMIFLLPSTAVAGGATLSPDSSPLAVGDTVPELQFQAELTPEQATYLGIPQDQGAFALGDLDADIVVLEVMSMYCPYCQKEAEAANTLHSLLDQQTAATIRMLGVAAGNSPFEAQIFVDRFGTTFPLIPDQDFTLHTALGQVGTPFFYVIDLRGQDPVVLMAQLGRMDSAESFFQAIMAAAGLE